MYRDKQFRPKPLATILEDIADARDLGPRSNKLFLCDGDALILPNRKLLPILEAIRSELPWIERVGTYGDTRSVTRKTIAELTELREAGLGIVYHGVETGDEAVMHSITKGGTRAECIDTAQRLRAAGIDHSVILLLGIGSVERSQAHAEATASLLTEMDPPYCGVLTTTVVPGTPLAELEANGAFTLPGPFEMLAELRVLIAEASLTGCRFSTNHASNYLPIRSILPRDREAILEKMHETPLD